jgi:phosphate transport system protein
MLDTGMELLSDELVQAGKLCEATVADLVAAYVRGDNVRKGLLERAQQMQSSAEDVDEIATDLIARHRPEDSDLRFIKSCKKITLEFARFGRYAYDISDLIARRQPSEGDDEDVKKVAERAGELIETEIRSLKNKDSALAESLRKMRISIDRLAGDIDTPRAASSALFLRYLEGVSAHAASIGDSVLYITAAEAPS